MNPCQGSGGYWSGISGFSRHANVASWLQADLQPPEIDFRLPPNSGHSEAHAGLLLVTPNGHLAPMDLTFARA